MSYNLHQDILPSGQLRLFETLSSHSFINDFYLAGGTCLALHIGHRQSIDFGFFIQDDFDTTAIINRLTKIGNYRRDNEEKNTINGSLNGIRISFFGYRYNIIDDFTFFNKIRLAGLKHIAAMKLEAIAGRSWRNVLFMMYYGDVFKGQKS